MGNYTEVFYHFVWATKRREPYLTPAIESLVHDFIRHKCNSLKVVVYALNGMPDHIHLACSLPMTLAPSDFLEKVKGSSAHFINHKPELPDNLPACLYWQPGVGALTFSKRDLPLIVGYIENQKVHHAAGTLSSKMERPDNGYPDAAPDDELSRG